MDRPILRYPVADYIISQPFWLDNTDNPPYDEFYRLFDNHHPGVDFPIEVGSNVTAAFDGIVVRNEVHPGMGEVIGVRNGNIVALYAHLSQRNVELGQVVGLGDRIGLSGQTGSACPTAHLHFELRDLTKLTLKEMVFEPRFGVEIEQWQDVFTYRVNNRNTPKNWLSLAALFFGIEDERVYLAEANSSTDPDRDQALTDDLKVIVPNFKINLRN